MAKPRVFVASTFFDLRAIRSDLDQFIKGMGYDPVLFEHGSIPYLQDRKVEESCYQEIQRSDIVVVVIGGQHGTESSVSPGSITQNELRRAVEEGKQTYVFVEETVQHDYRLFKRNEKNTTVKYDVDLRVLRFLDEVYALPTTAVQSFQTPRNIVDLLREQWAGLFQELLHNRLQVQQQQALHGLVQVAENLASLAADLKQDRFAALALGHPLQRRLQELLGLKHRAYVASFDELEEWLKSLGYSLDAFADDDSFVNDQSGARIRIRADVIFGKPPKRWLNAAVPWSDDYVEFIAPADPSSEDEDDDIPF